MYSRFSIRHTGKRECLTTFPVFLCFCKFFLAHSADRTYPVFRKILKSSSRSDPVIRIANFRIILVAARLTDIFFFFFPQYNTPEKSAYLFSVLCCVYCLLFLCSMCCIFTHFSPETTPLCFANATIQYCISCLGDDFFV